MALAALAQGGVASAALTQTKDPVRTLVSRADKTVKYWISFADCLSDDEFTFYLGATNTSGRNLEVWAATGANDCTQASTRAQINPVVCRKVVGATPISKTGTELKIKDSAIATGLGISDCQDSNTFGQQIRLQFMLTTGGAENVDASNVTTFDTTVDLVGPATPADPSAGVAEGAISVDFTKIDSTDVLDYAIYWDDGSGPANTSTQPGQGSSSSGSGGSGGGTSTTTTTTDDAGVSTAAAPWPPPPPPPDDAGAGGSGGTASAGGAGGASSQGGAGGAPTTTTTTASGGAGGAGGSGSCGADPGAGGSGTTTTTTTTTTSTTSQGVLADGCPDTKALVAGKVPDPGYANRIVSNGPSTISGLQNGTAYAVGVVARDKIGNMSPMSTIVCATPVEVTDFFETYRAAGGRAGGGCAVTSSRDRGLTFAACGLALVGLGLAARRRARRAAVTTSRGSR